MITNITNQVLNTNSEVFTAREIGRMNRACKKANPGEDPSSRVIGECMVQEISSRHNVQAYTPDGYPKLAATAFQDMMVNCGYGVVGNIKMATCLAADLNAFFGL